MNDFRAPASFLITLLITLPQLLWSYSDESHYSETFDETRYFRVFSPANYNSANESKRYPVIYFFHGCGGSYQRSGTYSYEDYGLTAPEVINRDYDPAYGFPNNAELENFVYNHEVIVISVDGKIQDLPGCGVYFPSEVDSWKGHYYNFSNYINELISVIDLRYNTKADPQYRAVSGLSMGGQMALWVAATNPHVFNSISEFCHSPSFYDVGEPEYQTTVDVMQLWRNFRGVKVRHTTTDRDYLRYYTDQLSASFTGAGFQNEYWLADYCKHHAARIDLQFEFHLNSFDRSIEVPSCFSYVNLYPTFEVWGYEISSDKKGNGWIYLHDITKNGLGIYTRKRLPFGQSLSEFKISLATPAIYKPNEIYTLSRYSYDDGTFSSQDTKADKNGKITITSFGGKGKEIGILGDELQPPVFILTDTVNENIYLTPTIETPLSFDIVNLSKSVQKVKFTVSTENKDLLSIVRQPKIITVPAQDKVHIDTLMTIKTNPSDGFKNTGYIKLRATIGGIAQQREHLIKVVSKNDDSQQAVGVKIFDGTSEELSLYKYNWNEWDDPLSSSMVSEGKGNGNGKVELDEIFSVWIQPQIAFDQQDTSWHPTIPVNRKENPDVSMEEMVPHRYNTGRSILSAQIRLNRKPTDIDPVRIPLQTEFLKVEYLDDDCHRNTADNFTIAYYDLVIYEDGSAAVAKSTR